jgi:Cyclin-dependent kinase regulatory subunit
MHFAFGVCALSSERISFPTAFFRLVSCQGACVLPFNVLIMSSSRIEYSEKYADDNYEYRYDIIPPMFLRKARITIPCRVPLNSSLTRSLVLALRSHVILPKDLAKTLPKSRLLTETEVRMHWGMECSIGPCGGSLIPFLAVI